MIIFVVVNIFQGEGQYSPVWGEVHDNADAAKAAAEALTDLSSKLSVNNKFIVQEVEVKKSLPLAMQQVREKDKEIERLRGLIETLWREQWDKPNSLGVLQKDPTRRDFKLIPIEEAWQQFKEKHKI